MARLQLCLRNRLIGEVMKKLIVMIMILVFMTGCATSGGYEMYLKTKESQITMARQPLVDLTITEDGKIGSIKMFSPPPLIKIEQERTHPGWAAFSGVIKICGIAGAIWATGDAVSSIIDAGSGTTTYINSGNNMSDNSGSIVTDYITTDTVTDTVTTTDTK